MEILAVLIMIVAGCATAVFALIAFALSRDEKSEAARAVEGRDQIAASLLYQVLVTGPDGPEEAMRRLRREAGIAASVTRGVDVTSWAEAFARSASDKQRNDLLETAVRMVAARSEPVSVRQYSALLDLSFGLGFRTDALARLRERYAFEYVDHAKDGRPREADRAGGSTPLFVREQAGMAPRFRDRRDPDAADHHQRLSPAGGAASSRQGFRQAGGGAGGGGRPVQRDHKGL